MMQSFTKTELAWIYNALDKQAIECIHVMNEAEHGNPIYHLAELKRDNIRSVMRKIHTALNDGSKRIEIKA